MDFLDSLILGVLQGVTEFLPISSSGHLVIGEQFLGLNVGELKSFDVTTHLGTLLAIFVYFRRDVWGLAREFFRLFIGKFNISSEYGKLLVFIVAGTLPAVFVGLFFEEKIDAVFRNVEMVAVMMIAVGVVFFVGEYFYRQWFKRHGGNAELTFGKAMIIGLAQAVALIPGVSRSGSTIVAGLFQGVGREKAARFSFLLGIPAILGAGILTLVESDGGLAGIEISESTVAGGGIGAITAHIGGGYNVLITGFLSSFLAGLLSVYLLMKFLKSHSLAVFGVYRIIVGVAVVLLFI